MKEKEFVERFGWVVNNVNYLVKKYGFPEVVDELIDILWEQYYMPNPAYSRGDIISPIGELEAFKNSLRGA